MEYLLVYSTGRNGKPYYYNEWIDDRGVSHWTATEDRKKAKVFNRSKDALDRYRQIHAYDKSYERFISEGKVRAEPKEQFGLPFH